MNGDSGALSISPLQLACQHDEHLYWIDGKKCSLVTKFFDDNNFLVEEATIMNEVDASQCCEAGFSPDYDAVEKPSLLMAC